MVKIYSGSILFRIKTFGAVCCISKAIAGEKNGGYGSGVSPKTALSVGLKVDAEALPEDLVEYLKSL